jgi:hypothetical protein
MGIHNSDLGNMSPLILRLLLQVGRQDAPIEEFVNGSIGEPDGPMVNFGALAQRRWYVRNRFFRGLCFTTNNPTGSKYEQPSQGAAHGFAVICNHNSRHRQTPKPARLLGGKYRLLRGFRGLNTLNALTLKPRLVSGSFYRERPQLRAYCR